MNRQIEKGLNLLWVDLTVADEVAGPHSLLNKYFSISHCGRGRGFASKCRTYKPDALCFEFDYPDRAGLRMVEESKRQFPSVPMFVLTLQHSEELAVWAFRAGMKDFLIKPLAEDDLLRCYETLEDVCDSRSGQVGRVISRADETMPLPVSAVGRLQGSKGQLEPALYYVEKHFRDRIRGKQVAALCNMSSFRFSRMFKESYGITFRDYVVRYRLREAANLLESGHVSVTDAAMATGFNDVAYFSRIFKKHFEQSPSAFVGVSADKSSVVGSETAMAEYLQLPAH